MINVERIKQSLNYRIPRLRYYLFSKPFAFFISLFWHRPFVYSIKETMEELAFNHKSICRYGNAEFDLIFGEDQPYQGYNSVLSRRLLEILKSSEDNICIGIPDVFDNLEKFEPYTKQWWKDYIISYQFRLVKLFHNGDVYYNSFISRTATDYIEDQTGTIIELFKTIWDDRDVVIIEGLNTKVGIGNNLLSNSKSVKRILVPNSNAFNKYHAIFSEVINTATKSDVLLLAAGPTATVLAYDLAKQGYQALDLGHFDIQYEHHIRGFKGKHAIPGKYFNEAGKANIDVYQIQVEEELYRSQIVTIIS